MRSATGHEAPLKLRPGGDRRLAILTRVSAGLGLAAIFLGNGSLFTRIFIAVLLGSAWLWIEIRRVLPTEILLIVYPDGHCRVNQQHAILAPRCWLSRWYCVLVCKGESGVQRLLISSGRHEPGEYRKLLSWMRLRNRADPLI